MNTTLPFDLQKAIDGHQLITRCGNPVIQGSFRREKGRTKAPRHYSAEVKVGSAAVRYSFTEGGHFLSKERPDEFDLFLLAEAPKAGEDPTLDRTGDTIAQVALEQLADARAIIELLLRWCCKKEDKMTFTGSEVYQMAHRFLEQNPVE